jgi:hypothetical protein
MQESPTGDSVATGRWGLPHDLIGSRCSLILRGEYSGELHDARGSVRRGTTRSLTRAAFRRHLGSESARAGLTETNQTRPAAEARELEALHGRCWGTGYSANRAVLVH